MLAAGDLWLFSSQQSSKLRLNRGDELTSERGANSSEKKEEECDHSIMWHVSVCVCHDGRRCVIEQATLLLIAYNYRYTHSCTHKLITKRISPPFGHEQCCYNFCHRQYLCAGGIWQNSPENCKVLIFVF